VDRRFVLGVQWHPELMIEHWPGIAAAYLPALWHVPQGSRFVRAGLCPPMVKKGIFRILRRDIMLAIKNVKTYTITNGIITGNVSCGRTG